MNKPFKKIKIIVHASTIVYFIACLLTGWFKESSIAFFIVLCHEYAHTLTALALDYQVKDIHLYPFGAFVDIGVHQDGLVHISKLTNKKFVKHPLEVVSVGDVVEVKVLSVDMQKKRIQLSMVL